ncbi:HepT-like ribonuclease domain-containing protein [Desulfitibacter alkalitolerans]|uniref:HepT-like ribonuclease domain-containing protein n=1 Tax=Desulfitibacter alkalitolerans TaxID=264641 RepID=UPI000486BF85|nr:HepT-like ribonuclease domain-containing protein [Desulfitibacter alkalitolerans]
MKHRDSQLIKKMILECLDIIRYTSEVNRGKFLENDLYQKATAMSIITIGEHANTLTRDIWLEHNEIEWRKIVDLRNIIAHGYGEVKMELVWNLAQNEIPKLLGQLESILKT